MGAFTSKGQPAVHHHSKDEEDKLREEFTKMAERLENWLHLSTGAHYVSAEHWEKRAKWSTYVTAVAMAVTGASGGGLLSSSVSGNPKFRAAAFATFGASLVVTGVEAFSGTQHNPENLSKEHERAAVKLKTLRGRVVKWKRTCVPNRSLSIAELDNEFEAILADRQQIEMDSLRCESWTHRTALDLMIGRDKVFKELIEDDNGE